MTNITSYRDEIRDAFIKRSAKPIFNSSIEHAAVLAEVMFEFAGENVDILSEKLDEQVYGRKEVIDKAQEFLQKRDGKIRILIESVTPEEMPNNPFFKALQGFKGFSLSHVPDYLHNTYDYNYMVADDRAYRYEEDRTNPAAVATSNYPEGAKDLSARFQSLWHIATRQEHLPA